MATNPDDARRILLTALDNDVLLTACHVLRTRAVAVARPHTSDQAIPPPCNPRATAPLDAGPRG